MSISARALGQTSHACLVSPSDACQVAVMVAAWRAAQATPAGERGDPPTATIRAAVADGRKHRCSSRVEGVGYGAALNVLTSALLRRERRGSSAKDRDVSVEAVGAVLSTRTAAASWGVCDCPECRRSVPKPTEPEVDTQTGRVTSNRQTAQDAAQTWVTSMPPEVAANDPHCLNLAMTDRHALLGVARSIALQAVQHDLLLCGVNDRKEVHPKSDQRTESLIKEELLLREYSDEGAPQIPQQPFGLQQLLDPTASPYRPTHVKLWLKDAETKDATSFAVPAPASEFWSVGMSAPTSSRHHRMTLYAEEREQRVGACVARHLQDRYCRLRSLELGGAHVGEALLRGVTTNSNRTLTHLSLQYVSFGVPLRLLAAGLQGCPTLQSLMFGHTHAVFAAADTDGFVELAALAVRTLTTLTIQHCGLGDGHCKQLLGSIYTYSGPYPVRNSGLNLNLSNNKISGNFFVGLAEVLERSCVHESAFYLRDLNLNHNPIGLNDLSCYRTALLECCRMLIAATGTAATNEGFGLHLHQCPCAASGELFRGLLRGLTATPAASNDPAVVSRGSLRALSFGTSGGAAAMTSSVKVNDLKGLLMFVPSNSSLTKMALQSPLSELDLSAFPLALSSTTGGGSAAPSSTAFPTTHVFFSAVLPELLPFLKVLRLSRCGLGDAGCQRLSTTIDRAAAKISLADAPPKSRADTTAHKHKRAKNKTPAEELSTPLTGIVTVPHACHRLPLEELALEGSELSEEGFRFALMAAREHLLPALRRLSLVDATIATQRPPNATTTTTKRGSKGGCSGGGGVSGAHAHSNPFYTFSSGASTTAGCPYLKALRFFAQQVNLEHLETIDLSGCAFLADNVPAVADVFDSFRARFDAAMCCGARLLPLEVVLWHTLEDDPDRLVRHPQFVGRATGVRFVFY